MAVELMADDHVSRMQAARVAILMHSRCVYIHNKVTNIQKVEHNVVK